jgi:ABC-type dipeptide/oligopeptide/nickel transport system ATPase subunit
LDITRIIISQDILLALSLCDRIAVMYRGEIIRVAPAKSIAKDRGFLKEIGIDFQPYLDIIKKIK